VLQRQLSSVQGRDRVKGDKYNIETETERRTVAAPAQDQPNSSQKPRTTTTSSLHRSSNSKPGAAGAGDAVKHSNRAACASGSIPATACLGGSLRAVVAQRQPDGSSNSSRPDRFHPHRHARVPARAPEAKVRAPRPRLNPFCLDPLALAAQALPAMAVRRPMATPPCSGEVLAS
jgi:hypothetical protein